MTFLGLRLPILLLLILGFPVIGLFWLGLYAMTPGPPSTKQQIAVTIPARASLSAVEEILAENQVIRDDVRFAMLAILKGSATKLKAGEYVFDSGKNPLEVIGQLEQGKVYYREVTIPEGTTLSGVAEILGEEGWVDYQQFLNLTQDQELLEGYGIGAASLEGYLFPDTYFLSRGQQGEAEIIQVMLDKHFSIFNELARNSEVFPSILSHHEIVTLASIVEKETGLADERPLVASVFLNRLEKGMRLQADPTVRYGRSTNSGPISRDELEEPSVYNTYKISGLPPGPISNPGRASLEAVLFPAETDFLYFVARDDRSHYFSKTLQEHNKAVAKFRKRN